jgi:hypothetical protein
MNVPFKFLRNLYFHEDFAQIVIMLARCWRITTYLCDQSNTTVLLVQIAALVLFSFLSTFWTGPEKRNKEHELNILQDFCIINTITSATYDFATNISIFLQ